MGLGSGLTCGGGSARGECHLLVHELGARPGLMLEQRHARAPLLALDLVRVRVRAWVRVRAIVGVRVRVGVRVKVRVRVRVRVGARVGVRVTISL